MAANPEHIYPEFECMLGRVDKESLLKQKSCVLWFYGLSGSGKSTLANALERQLNERGVFTQILDGDNIRSGLNQDLGFSDADREENIRRIAEVAKLFLNAGAVTIASFITPKSGLRATAREIIGSEDFREVYVKCSFEKCAERDVKGLYAKANSGEVKQFTGMGSDFEEPDNADLIIDTEIESIESSLEKLSAFVESFSSR